MKHERARYQVGSLITEARANGPDVWVYRWRENAVDGSRVKRKKIVGTVEELRNKSAAMREVESLALEINAKAAIRPSRELTIEQTAKHYQTVELDPSAGKSQRTCEVYAHQLNNVILPRWGTHRLSAVSPIAIERWLQELPHAAGTKAKKKCVFSVLYQHAMRYKWATFNPVRLARQSALSVTTKVVLCVEEIKKLLAELIDPFRTIVLMAAVLGLRRGELFGLKWRDINFDNATLTVSRSLVDMVEGPPKTLASRTPIPLADEVIEALKAWMAVSDFVETDDWIFASPHALGKKPYWPDAVLKRHILPAATRAGISKGIGWHSFRRTLATLLLSGGANVKVTQDLMRHSTSQMTLDVYAQGVPDDKRLAQSQIAALISQPETKAA